MNKQATYNQYYRLGQEYALTKLAKPTVARVKKEIKGLAEDMAKQEAKDLARPIVNKAVKNIKKRIPKKYTKFIPKVTSFRELEFNDPQMDKLKLINKNQPKGGLKVLPKKMPKVKGVSLSWDI